MDKLTRQEIAGAYSAAGDIVGMLAAALAPKLNVSPEFLLRKYTTDECMKNVAAMYARRVKVGMCKVDAAAQVAEWLKGCTVQLFTEMKAAA